MTRSLHDQLLLTAASNPFAHSLCRSGAMSKSLIQSGRPRLMVDFGLLLDLREKENLGWSRVAREYTRRTGLYISKQTCKRRYEEITSRGTSDVTFGLIAKPPRSPPDT